MDPRSYLIFGEDPDMVTIFGESAGAMSLSLLSVIPEANVLFENSIMESGNYGRIKTSEKSM